MALKQNLAAEISKTVRELVIQQQLQVLADTWLSIYKVTHTHTHKEVYVPHTSSHLLVCRDKETALERWQ